MHCLHKSQKKINQLITIIVLSTIFIFADPENLYESQNTAQDNITQIRNLLRPHSEY